MNNPNKIIQSLAKEIVNRKMSVPAIFFLESTKYVSFIGSQFLVFLGPVATCFVKDCDDSANRMENTISIE